MGAGVNTKKDVAAVVVGFYPDEALLKTLITAIKDQVLAVFLIDNGGCSTIDWRNFPSVVIVPQEKNHGLGHALNLGFRLAKSAGAKFVCTFDQDSSPPTDLIVQLHTRLLGLLEKNANCAAVGPTFFDVREMHQVTFPFIVEINKKIKRIFPDDNAIEPTQTDILITSGMLVRVDVWDDELHYDETLFIDLTDNEWCLRARNKGYQLFGCPDVVMGHEMSSAPPIRKWGIYLFRQSPLRRYYSIRNTILCLKRNYISLAWKKRLLAGLLLRFLLLPFYENSLSSQYKMIGKGIIDGFLNKSGPFPEKK